MSEERYTRNFPSISEEDQAVLASKTVAILGCGGLGGPIIESLARIGVGRLKLVDCDEFSVTNLNRQLVSSEANMGKRKALEAMERVHLINSLVKVEVVDEKITKENAKTILEGSDIVLDALDNIDARFAAADAAEELSIHYIHGAIGGWRFQISTIAPGTKLLDKIYPRDLKAEPPSVLSFTPVVAAGIEVAEAIKVLLGKDDTLEGKLLIGDIESNTYIVVKL